MYSYVVTNARWWLKIRAYPKLILHYEQGFFSEYFVYLQIIDFLKHKQKNSVSFFVSILNVV